MIQVHVIESNPFAENTYVVFDETKDCVIFDPGCYTAAERAGLKAFIEQNGLNPVRLINTHCHLDHVFGNQFVASTWGLALEAHRDEIPVLARFDDVCRMYGVPGTQSSPAIARFIEDGDIIRVGNFELEALLTPGHSPGSLSFYCKADDFVVAGDVLFMESIGRSDLPGGDHAQLLESIRSRLFILPEQTVVYPGHGPGTTIRHEKMYNPFLT